MVNRWHFFSSDLPEGIQQFLALGRAEAQPAVAAGADDGGVGGGGFGCG